MKYLVEIKLAKVRSKVSCGQITRSNHIIYLCFMGLGYSCRDQKAVKFQVKIDPSALEKTYYENIMPYSMKKLAWQMQPKVVRVYHPQMNNLD